MILKLLGESRSLFSVGAVDDAKKVAGGCTLVWLPENHRHSLILD